MTKTPTSRASIWMDTSERYGLVSRALHWGMAYLLVGQFIPALTWKAFGSMEVQKAIIQFGPHHGTAGLLIFMLVAGRAAWALLNRKRRPPHEAGWRGRVTIIGHCAIYFLVFAIPALALLRIFGRGKGWSQWGFQIIPQTGEEVAWMIAPANVLHGPLSWLLCLLISGHIVMALHHHFIRRVPVLARMCGSLRTRQAPPQTAQSNLKEIRNVA